MPQHIKELTHARRNLPSGGQVVVLNTGALIGPEAEAMLQALYSRSVGSIDAHLEVLAKKGPARFMETYYVGYGHKSIGDCGTMTVFIERVSMLAAKAIQDWRLYSGQESSTRFIDFANQPFSDPLHTEQSAAILERWRAFYLSGLAEMVPALAHRFPRRDTEKEGAYEKAVMARAFDIMRGFLPAGAETNLSWHANLRQTADKLALLRHHPLPEVQSIAHAFEEAVTEAFPSSFSHKRHDATEDYNASWMKNQYLFTDDTPPAFAITRDSIDRQALARDTDVLKNRPPKTELPPFLAECGDLQACFLLDFGSFRDIQRHRAVVQRMPLVTDRYGFHQWYLGELTEELRRNALALLKAQQRDIAALGVTDEMRQYYHPMGYMLPNKLTGTLPALVYLVELRATRFVHPTLCERAIELARELAKRFGEYGLVLHLDNEPHRFDARRGEHDIVVKKE